MFARGDADTGDRAWLQAMLDTEAALARALERAGLAPAGSGAAVTAVARADFFDNGALSEAATSTGNPVPALVRALTGLLPESAAGAAGAVHRGAGDWPSPSDSDSRSRSQRETSMINRAATRLSG